MATEKSDTPGGPDSLGESAFFFEAANLGRPGSALWADLVDPASESRGSAAVLALILEACRIVDRLAKLDGLLSGRIDTWAHLESRADRVVSEDVAVIELKVDSAAGEARQQASVLRQLLAEIHRRKGEQDLGDENPLDDL